MSSPSDTSQFFGVVLTTMARHELECQFHLLHDTLFVRPVAQNLENL